MGSPPMGLLLSTTTKASTDATGINTFSRTAFQESWESPLALDVFLSPFHHEMLCQVQAAADNDPDRVMCMAPCERLSTIYNEYHDYSIPPLTRPE